MGKKGLNGSGFEKMEIKPFENSSAQEMSVSVNPESYKRTYEVGDGKGKHTVIGADGTKYIRRMIDPIQNLSFDLWFDSTGAIPNSKDVELDIKSLTKLLVVYQGTEHAIPMVQLIWGNGLEFKGQCTSLVIDYLHFSPEGEPLRAKASVSLSENPDQKNREFEKGRNSPDLTHLRMVQDGDSLPLMCYRIYKDPTFYIQVAEANGLINFTDLQPGQRLYFPPLRD